MHRSILLAFALLALGCSGSPSSEAEQPWTRYELQGEVIMLRPGDPPVAVVEHGDIEGFMKAMTMGFPVRDPEEFAKLSEGVRFEAAVMARGYAEYYLEDITVLEPSDPDAEQSPEEPSDPPPR